MGKNEQFGEMLIEALEEAVAFERGELPDVRVERVALDARVAEVSPPPRYSPEEIRRIRKRLSVSQPVFGAVLNASPATIRAWERGVREPDGPSLRLLEIADKHPEVLAGSVRQRKSRRASRAVR